MNIAYKNASEAFEDLYNFIRVQGIKTNVGTLATYNVGFYLLNPTQRVITTEWRKFSSKYAEREWNWYLSQNRSVEEIKKFAPIWDKMHGGDNLVNSNYGWQWGRNNQLDKCIEQLKKNKDSRQAWLTIFDGKEKDSYEFDTPCTLSVGFDVKPGIGTLDMCVTMRSNDLVYGFCNDQYCFSKLQEVVAKELDLEKSAVEEMYKQYDFNMETTDADIKAFQNVADFMLKTGMIESEVNAEELFIK
jgi:thymidylate synthase